MAIKTTVTFKNTENALMNVRGAEPKVDSDFTTKNYVDGQIHGMFIINLTENVNNKTYTADKTYEQIKAAYNNKQNLAVRLNSASEAQFPLLSVEFSGENAGFTFGYTEMKAGEQLVVTRAILYNHRSNPVSDTWEDADKTGYFIALDNNESSQDYGSVTSNINMGLHAITNIQKLHINGEAPLYIGKVIETQDPNKPRLTGVAGTNEAAFVKSDKQTEYVPVFVDTPTKNNHASTKKYVDDKIAGLVPESRTVNNKPLANNISLAASDVNALPLSGGTLTGDLTVNTKISTPTLSVTNKASCSQAPTEGPDLCNKTYVDGIFSYDSTTKTLSITIV